MGMQLSKQAIQRNEILSKNASRQKPAATAETGRQATGYKYLYLYEDFYTSNISCIPSLCILYIYMITNNCFA